MPINANISLHRPEGGGDLDSKLSSPFTRDPFVHGEILDVAGVGFGPLPQFAFAGGKTGRLETTAPGLDVALTDNFYITEGAPKNIIADTERGNVWHTSPVGANGPNGVFAHDWGTPIQPGSKIFRHWTVKHRCDAPQYQWKFWRQEASMNYVDGGPECFSMFWKKDVGRYYGVRPVVSPGDPSGIMNYFNGTGIRMDGSPAWFSLDYYQELSDLGVNNGSDYGIASSDIGVSTLFNLTDTMHLGAGMQENQYPRWQVVQNYLGNFNEGNPTIGDVWIDDFFVQVVPPGGALVRALVTNNSVFGSSTLLTEIQEPFRGWKNNRARIRLNRGGLPAGDYWLHFISNTDTILTTIPIAIGN